MDTLVTLAPLLGLLGTVTGLMRAFLSVGSAELSVVSVTGGIGEALIATACGLGIAILSLVPFNYFTGRVARLQFELEAAATNVDGHGASAQMKLPSPVKRRHSRIEIIPLIDIMFFLLASFMMVSLQWTAPKTSRSTCPTPPWPAPISSRT
jgi:hypothetical protein